MKKIKILNDAQIEYISDCIHTINDIVEIACIVLSAMTVILGIAYACDAPCGGYALTALILLLLFVILYCVLPNSHVWEKMRRQKQKDFLNQNNSSNK